MAFALQMFDQEAIGKKYVFVQRKVTLASLQNFLQPASMQTIRQLLPSVICTLQWPFQQSLQKAWPQSILRVSSGVASQKHIWQRISSGSAKYIKSTVGSRSDYVRRCEQVYITETITWNDNARGPWNLTGFESQKRFYFADRQFQHLRKDEQVQSMIQQTSVETWESLKT